MKLQDLLEIVGDEPLFETGLLLAGDAVPADVRRQLSRWTREGRVYQLRRGLYTLARPYRKVVPHPFLVANHMLRGSYVSLQSALAHYGLIPEAVPAVTSVTTVRTVEWDTPLGRYAYRRIQPALFYGYRRVEIVAGQRAFVASPEKALLDLLYLEPGGATLDYLRALRLQHLDTLDLEGLHDLAERSDRPNVRRAAAHVEALAQAEVLEYEVL